MKCLTINLTKDISLPRNNINWNLKIQNTKPYLWIESCNIRNPPFVHNLLTTLIVPRLLSISRCLLESRYSTRHTSIKRYIAWLTVVTHGVGLGRDRKGCLFPGKPEEAAEGLELDVVSCASPCQEAEGSVLNASRRSPMKDLQSGAPLEETETALPSSLPFYTILAIILPSGSPTPGTMQAKLAGCICSS